LRQNAKSTCRSYRRTASVHRYNTARFQSRLSNEFILIVVANKAELGVLTRCISSNEAGPVLTCDGDLHPFSAR
jgi:hypothetical protein